MSRVGKQPIKIEDGVNVTVSNHKVNVEGPKGKLMVELPRGVKAIVDNSHIKVSLSKGSKAYNLHGLFRTLIKNAVVGVSSGWSKSLELVGVGFHAQTTGQELELRLGFSHPVKIKTPEGIKLKVENKKIIVSGPDKYLVGETAAIIRRVKPPDAYKGKGVRYEGEKIRTKPGKAAKGIGTVLGK